ncbi:hypothetical protein [Roseateles cavernae]|uniref:hypothetical protein n=1 Tax=Roseateles cavernae TaxID=3153578 RepID=UPI0032E445E6
MPAQRQASAFQITVGPDRAWCVLMAALAVLAGGALLAALMSQSGLGLPAIPRLGWLLFGALLLPGAGWLGWRCGRTRPANLRWDAQQWWLDETPVRPRVVIDLGAWLLLRLALRSRLPCYLPLARTSCAAQWPQLRATLYSARTAPSPEP